MNGGVGGARGEAPYKGTFPLPRNEARGKSPCLAEGKCGPLGPYKGLRRPRMGPTKGLQALSGPIGPLGRPFRGQLVGPEGPGAQGACPPCPEGANLIASQSGRFGGQSPPHGAKPHVNCEAIPKVIRIGVAYPKGRSPSCKAKPYRWVRRKGVALPPYRR